MAIQDTQGKEHGFEGEELGFEREAVSPTEDDSRVKKRPDRIIAHQEFHII
jgi:hypothetical protein